MKIIRKIVHFVILAAMTAMIWQCVEQPTKPEYDNPLDPEYPGEKPFVLTADLFGGGIRLQWTTLDIPLIQKYFLFRSVNDSEYDTLTVIEYPDTLIYMDMDVQNGNIYKYYLTVTDSVGNQISSNSQIVEISSDPVVMIADSNGYAVSRAVDVSFIAFNAVQMKISAGGLAGVWQSFSPTAQVILEAGPGIKVVTAKFKYADGDSSIAVSDTTLPAPIICDVSINDEEEYADGRLVELSLPAKYAVSMNISNLPPSVQEFYPSDGLNSIIGDVKGIEGGADTWIPYEDSLMWFLESGEGMKVVYAQFKDDFEIVETVSDTIYPLPMTADLSINRDAQYTLNRLVWLYPQAGGTGITCTYSLDSSFPLPAWSPMTDSVQFTLNAGGGAKVVYGRFRNDFGIIETAADTIFPQPMNASVDINRGGQYTAGREVWVYCFAAGGDSMMLSEQANFSGMAWLSYVDSTEFTLSLGGGVKTVYAKFKNDFGEESTTSDFITTTPLTGTIEIERGAQYTASRDVWVYPEAEGDELQVILSENSDLSGGTWVGITDSLEFALSAGIGTKTIYAKFRNVFEAESDVTADVIEPAFVDYDLQIGNGGLYTNSSLVDLNFLGEGALEFKYGESSDPELFQWEEFSALVEDFQLSSGSFYHKVFGWFRNDFYEAGPESAAVYVDTECQIQDFTFSAGPDTLETGDIIMFELTMQTDDIGDETDGTALVTLAGVFDGMQMTDNGDGTYILNYTVQSDDYCEDEAPTVSFTDRAGNNAQATASGNLTIINNWQITIGSTGDELAYSAYQTYAGGYIVVGETNSVGAGGMDMWLARISVDGDIIWEQTFGGLEDDGGRDIIQTMDGGFLAVGYTNSEGAGGSDFYVVKVNSSGGEEWTQTFGGSGIDQCNSIVEGSDGGYILCGSTSSMGAGNSDIWMVKIDANGSQVWARTNGSTNAEYGNDIAVDTDGGYVITGKVSLTTASYVKILKVDSQGYEEWSNSYLGTISSAGKGIILSVDGGYIIAANTTVGFPTGTLDMCLIKASSAGAKLWDETYGSNIDDCANSVAQMSDGRFILAGGIDGAFTLLKTDNSGNEISRESFGGTISDQARSIINTTDGGYLAVGWITSGGGNGIDALVVKLSAGY